MLTFMFLLQWLQELWQGNPVAYLAVGLLFAVMGLGGVLVFVFYKLRGPQMELWKNNVFDSKPILADATDDQRLRFRRIDMFREGIGYSAKSGWHFFFHPTEKEKAEVGAEACGVITKSYTVDGCPGSMWLSYSRKGVVVNPEVLALQEQIEQESEEDQKLPFKDRLLRRQKQILIPKKMLISVLQKMEEKFVQINPISISTLVDPRKIKEYMAAAAPDSQLLALERKAREMERESSSGQNSKILILLLVAVLAISVVGVVKSFGFF